MKLKRKKRQLKVASAEFDDFAQKHRLEGNDEDLEEGVDYKYLYHASLQKQAEKKILMEPSVRRVSLYK